jgi:hypothetical protein
MTVLFSEADSNDDGKIDFDEFKSMQLKWIDTMKTDPESFAVLGFIGAAASHPMDKVKASLTE